MGCECGDLVCDASGVDGSLGKPGSGRKIFGEAGGDEDGSGIEHDHVAGRTGDAGEDVAKEGGVGLGVATGECGEWGGFQAEVGKVESAESDLAG